MEVANPHFILLALLNPTELLEAEFKTGVLGRHCELLLLPALVVLLLHQLVPKLDGFIPSQTFLEVSTYCVFVLVKLQFPVWYLTSDVNCERLFDYISNSVGNLGVFRKISKNSASILVLT